MVDALITGASGFLGRAVAARLPAAVALSSADLDLTDGAAVDAAFRQWRPRVVIHLAARVGGVTANIARPADFLIDNIRIDGNVLAALRSHRPEHFIPLLSTCMYPDRLPDDAYPMTEDVLEDGPPPPTNAAYAAAKRALWHGAVSLHRQYGVPFTALLPSNLYGPGDHFGSRDSHFLAAAVSRIEEARARGDESVVFFGTGRALRQFLFVDDVARLIAHLVDRGPVNETLNVAPGHNHSIAELARAVADAAGYHGTIAFDGDGPDGQFRKDVSSARLATVVPEWKEMETGLAAGLRQTIDWYRDHVASG